MNPTEIANALDALAQMPFAPNTFGLSFAEATDNPQATLAKLRNGSTGKSDMPGGMLLSHKFHYAPAEAGQVEAVLAQLRVSKKNKTGKPAILLATDGETIAAEHPKSGAILHCAFSELGTKFSFFLPAAGKERYQAAEENPVDVRATGKLARLYDSLLKANSDWRTEGRRHDMNLFMTRLIFCLFAEDVGVFPESQFSSVLFEYSGDRGEHARDILIQAFTAMNLPERERLGLPVWARVLKYVNGGLFAGDIDAPVFDIISFRYLRDAAKMDWKLINPDIFGSMIQSIADEKARSELGMHYTSVPNIMRVLGPLFLDDLDAEIEKAWDKPAALRVQLARLSKIRVFDPACGSGNFLVVAYRQMRERELRLMKRLGELDPATTTMQMFSSVGLDQFYGIEINDFAAETAKLALFIAEYQANAQFKGVFGQMPALLPLRGGGTIECGNALRLHWEEVCPTPSGDGELYICGNPPYYGAKKREAWQTEDMVRCGLGDLLLLDYVSAWFFKAAEFSGGQAPFAFVATSSICQGEQVAPLWSRLFELGVEINFAYRPFIWRNSAADNAGVWVTIVGLSRRSKRSAYLYDERTVSSGMEISPYLYLGPFIPVYPSSKGLFGAPPMVMGSNPVDGKRLSLTSRDRQTILRDYPAAERFIRPYIGGDELIEGAERYCIWVDDDDLGEAMSLSPIKERILECQKYRLSAGRDAKKSANRPHRFCYSTYENRPSLAIPNTQSSERVFIPATFVKEDVVISKEAFAIYDAPTWLLSVVSSSLHRVWLAAVGGRIGNGFRYSVRIVYNTFPVPFFSEEQIHQLDRSALTILRSRYQNHPRSLAELYAPGMPEDLRQAHRDNDDLLESMYIGRPFRNDTERLETLFKLYDAKTAQ